MPTATSSRRTTCSRACPACLPAATCRTAAIARPSPRPAPAAWPPWKSRSSWKRAANDVPRKESTMTEAEMLADDRPVGATVVLWFTAGVGAVIVGLSFVFFYKSFSLPESALKPIKDAFDAAVVNVLLKMFLALLPSVLAYIFGKPVANALRDRIRHGVQPRPA